MSHLEQTASILLRIQILNEAGFARFGRADDEKSGRVSPRLILFFIRLGQYEVDLSDLLP